MAFDLEARRAEVAARKAAALASLTEDDQAEIEAREQLARDEAEVVELERKRRELDLSRRVERAQAALVEGARVTDVAIKEREDTFVVADPGPAAYRLYMKQLGLAAKSNKGNDEAHRDYAKAAVYDWNGVTDWNAVVDGKANGARLAAFLRENPAVALTVANAAAELAGFAREERKSGR